MDYSGFGLMAQFNGLQARGSSHETNPFTVGGPYTNSDGTIWYKSTMKFTDVSIQALINLNNVIWGYKPGRRHRVHLAGVSGGYIIMIWLMIRVISIADILK